MQPTFTTVLNQHLNNIGKPQSKSKLLIFIGFDKQSLSYMPSHVKKLLSVDLETSLNTLIQSKPSLVQELILNTTSCEKHIYWCTYEEFLIIGSDIISLYFDHYFLQNNVYHRKFPLIYQIDELEEIYRGFFANDEYSSEEFAHPLLNDLLNMYGDIKKINNRFYVSYTLYENGIDFFPSQSGSITLHQSISNQPLIELTEEEDQFLEFTEKLISGQIKQSKIYISYNGDINLFPNNYPARLSVLQFLFPDIEFILSPKILDPREEIYDDDYISILKKYWGFSSFRPLKMYKNINDVSSKETVSISQGQIIDDIVKQAENAQKGLPFRDIFVTSPTGAGKSIMFQIPAIYLAEKYGLMTIIISPLIGLMRDQVYSLQERNVEISATINSEITPLEKAEIIQKIKDRQVSILYISPETLLSRSDIKQLIGDRQIGLFVIDEAHIVTTWGKAFRSDYWYLGSYLQKIRKENKFPIATFTATAIYGGIEDMYGETRDSLSMINPISYFGYIKRDDLAVNIQKARIEKDSFGEYLSLKYSLLLKRLSHFLDKKQKTLVYFPIIRYIHDFIKFVKSKGPKEIQEQIVKYYGSMTKEEKTESFLKFRNGDSLIMLATKAFGMGIDIPDIYNVLHFAPTGNVCDYIQEIGRAARQLERGRAFFDYFSRDFVHVNRLHGISTLKKYQLIQVIEKIVNIIKQSSKEGKFSRNLLVSAEEFRYIFERKTRNDQDADIDNKLKTALLIIEKDFINKLGYSPIVARPRSLFTNEYFAVDRRYEEILQSEYHSYFRIVETYSNNQNNIYSNVYTCDMKKLWEDQYNHLSFAQFKHHFHHQTLDLPFIKYLQPVLQLKLKINAENLYNFLSKAESDINQIADLFGEFVHTRRSFDVSSLSRLLQKTFRKSSYYCDSLASILLQSAEGYNRLLKETRNFHTNFINFYEDRNTYTITSGFFEFTNWLKNDIKNLFNKDFIKQHSKSLFERFIARNNRNHLEKTFILLGVLEALGLLVYKICGGDNPEIYIRVNSKLQLEHVISQPTKYTNNILENVYKRHQISVAMLTFLFENEVRSDEFWEYIEDYFLGRIPNEVLARIN
ncbi:helicase-related protein [Anoxybacillus geothermalis]|nr:helicase-related protein [Anoxybacillus geothermalis]WJQ15366.1 helicase-related protein [Geobacillus stearothermophilus]